MFGKYIQDILEMVKSKDGFDKLQSTPNMMENLTTNFATQQSSPSADVDMETLLNQSARRENRSTQDIVLGSHIKKTIKGG
jgi:hypothetical protein